MTCFYIKEASEKNKFKLKYKYIFNQLEIQENAIEFPIREKQKIGNRKIKNLVQRLEENNVRLVALSKVLNRYEQLKNEMYSNNIDILDERYLFKILSENILEYICKKLKCDIQNTEVSILVNNANNQNKNIILGLSKKVKMLNIITNHINDFRDIEKFLYNENGIVINISNNKKKSLLNSKILLNLDFCAEDINTYNIPKNSIIINTNNEIKIRTKKFNGINVNSYNIIMPSKYKMSGFSDEIIYESLIYNMDYENARNKILEDKIKIKNLIGEKGIIHEREFDKL